MALCRQYCWHLWPARALAQVSITTANTPVTIDFDNTLAGVNNGAYAGTGFLNTPGTGQLDAHAWAITGLSDGDKDFDIENTTGDYAMGTSTGGVGTGGLYAFDTSVVSTPNYSFGFQPTDVDFTPGTITLKIQNNTGADATIFEIAYDIYVLNDQGSSSSVTFSYSTDNSTYTDVPVLTQNTIAPAAVTPTWQVYNKTTTIDLTGTPVADGGYFYIRWTTNDASVSGNRDEIALDNIASSVKVLNPDQTSDVQETGVVKPDPGTISSLDDTEGEAVRSFSFNVQDLGGDGLDTKVESLRIVPGPNNNADWTDNIQGLKIDDGSFYLNTTSINVSDNAIDINFAEGEFTVPDGSTTTATIRIWLNSNNISDGDTLEFAVETNDSGFSTYATGSGFNNTLIGATSNIIQIDVQATQLAISAQPGPSNCEGLALSPSPAATAQDANGNTDLDYTGTVTLTNSASLPFTGNAEAAANGIATFSNLIFNGKGSAVTLSTTNADGLTDATSDPFDLEIGEITDLVASADNTKVTLTWSNPASCFEQVMIVAGTSSISNTPSGNGSAYTANLAFGSGTDLGGGEYVVYKGATSPQTVTGLTNETPYYFKVFSRNGTGWSDGVEIMATPGLLSQDFTLCPPSGWLNVINSGNGWQCNAGTGNAGYESVNGIGGTTASQAWLISPKRNFDVQASEALSFDTWTDGTDISYPTLQVLYSSDYSGSGNPNVATWTPLEFTTAPEASQTWTPSGVIDLSGLTGNNYIAFKYTSSGTTSGTAAEWRIDNIVINNNGCTEPTTAASNLAFGNIAQTGMTLSWTPGNGVRRIVVAKAGTAVDADPVDGTVYTADANFGDGDELGTGNFVLYNGTGSSVDVTGQNPNTTYYYAIYEYNCDGLSSNYFDTPGTGNQATLDPNGSDIVAMNNFTYPSNIDYSQYQALSASMTSGNSLDVFGLTLRDGGAAKSDPDALDAKLTSISFSTNGSKAVRAAAIYDGVNFTPVNVNGATSFTIDLSANNVVALDNDSIDFELYVTYESGVHIVDNQQVQFTVTAATTDAGGSSLAQPDGGGAASSTSGDDNRIIVTATELQFVQVPEYSTPLNGPFTVEVEAVDANGTWDRDKSLTISATGPGNLSAASGLTKSTADSTALWSDLMYDTEGSIILTVSDGGSLSVVSGAIDVKPRFSIYTFTGASGDEATFAPDDQADHLTISDISRGSAIVAHAYGDTFSADHWPQTAVLDANSYYELTITADPGFEFSISSMEVDHRSSGSGPDKWSVRSDAGGDNFSTDIDGTFTSATNSTFTRNSNVDFSSVPGSLNTITVRIYAYESSSDLGTWAIDNLEIFGTITDVDPPDFTAGYPQAFNNTADSVGLIVNLDEIGKVYYLAQPTGDPAPDGPTVIAADNIIDVPEANVNYTATVLGLTAASGYDVYFVAEDLTGNQSDPPTALTNIRTSDIDSDIAEPTSQVPAGVVPSTANSPGLAVDVFKFVIEDKGTSDGLPTKVSQIVIDKGVTATNPADWPTTIRRIKLVGNTLGTIPVIYWRVRADSILMEMDTAYFKIPNGSQEEITASVILNQTGIVDNTELEFQVSTVDGNNATSVVGSQFASPISSGTGVTSNIFTINVDADHIVASGYPVSINNGDPFGLTIQSIDANGNVDEDGAFDVTLGIRFGTGTLSSSTGLTQTLVNGAYTWTDLMYSGNDESFSIQADAAPTGVQDTVTDKLIVSGAPSDLVVNSNLILNQDLTVTNVIITPTGNLKVSPGYTLSVAGDYTNNGILSDQGGTTVFNGTAAQEITGSTSPTTFYNITVTNSAAAVTANTSINLINTLTLEDGAIFDADGTSDDMDFTLVSDADGTARIAPILNGAVLNGEIVTQRFLPANTPGSRYVSVPVKGQTLNSWTDDFRIQGVTGLRPGYDPNVWTYNESLGTNGAGGTEGWTPYQNLSDPIPMGPGTRIYTWSQFMHSDVIIDNKGLPFTGDGTANDGSGTFTYSLSLTPSAYSGGAGIY